MHAVVPFPAASAQGAADPCTAGFRLREERLSDLAAREALLDRAFGSARFTKTSERLRAGRLPAEGLALVAASGDQLLGTVRLWHVSAGPARPALLLGPLAVEEAWRGAGIGAALMRTAITRAQALGHRAILLVGDVSYYARFGFAAGLTTGLDLPGPVDRERFLALELQPGALAGAHGLVRASGRTFIVGAAPTRSFRKAGGRLRAA